MGWRCSCICKSPVSACDRMRCVFTLVHTHTHTRTTHSSCKRIDRQVQGAFMAHDGYKWHVYIHIASCNPHDCRTKLADRKCAWLPKTCLIQTAQTKRARTEWMTVKMFAVEKCILQCWTNSNAAKRNYKTHIHYWHIISIVCVCVCVRVERAR